MRLVVVFGVGVLSLDLAGGALAQAPPAASAPPGGALERSLEVGGWTLSDTGAKAGDDSEREVRLARKLETVDFVLRRSGPDSASLTIRFSRCEGLSWNSGLALEGAIPARVDQIKDEIHDAFHDFAKRCPPKAGEEAALLEGFDAADRLVETWIRDRPFVYPPEPAEPK